MCSQFCSASNNTLAHSIFKEFDILACRIKSWSIFGIFFFKEKCLYNANSLRCICKRHLEEHSINTTERRVFYLLCMLLLNVFPSEKYEKYNFKIFFYGMCHKIIFFFHFQCLVEQQYYSGNINNHNNINYIKNPYMAYIHRVIIMYLAFLQQIVMTCSLLLYVEYISY